MDERNKPWISADYWLVNVIKNCERVQHAKNDDIICIWMKFGKCWLNWIKRAKAYVSMSQTC
jgi:hypothetical protein